MLAKQTAQGATTLALGLLTKRAVDFASMLILARLLTPTDFGLVALATTTMMVFMSVSDLAISDALVQMEKPDERHFRTAWTFGILRGLFTFALMAGGSVILAAVYRDNRLIPITCVLGLAVLFKSSVSPGMAHFTRRMSFRQETIIEVGSKVGAFAGAVAVAWVTRSYWAIVASQVVAALGYCVLSYIFAPMRIKLGLSGWRDLVGFSGWVSLQRLVNTINNYVDRYFAVGYIGKSQLGFYVLGSDWAALPTLTVQAPLAKALFASLSTMQSNLERMRAAYLSGQAACAAVLMPIGLGMALVAKPLVLIALGPAWLPAVPIIQVLAPVLAVYAMAAPAQAVAMARNATHLIFTRDLANLAIRVPLIIAGVILYGMPGLLVARVFAGLASIYMDFSMVKQVLSISVFEQLSSGRRSLGAGLVMLCAVVLMQHELPWDVDHPLPMLIASAVLGAATYLLSHLFFWLIEERPTGPETQLFALLSCSRWGKNMLRR